MITKFDVGQEICIKGVVSRVTCGLNLGSGDDPEKVYYNVSVPNGGDNIVVHVPEEALIGIRNNDKV